MGATGVTAGGVPVQGSTFLWVSSNPAVATVDQQGRLTAVSEGTTTITVFCTNAAGGAVVSSTAIINVRPGLVRLVLNTTGTGSGTLSSSPPGSEFESGTRVDITATPGQGSVFNGFAGPCTVNGRTCTVTMRSPGPVVVTATFSLCDKSYCGTIRIEGGRLNFVPVGFGYDWSGYFDYSFDPAPRAEIRIQHRLNAASISGVATTTGASTLRIPFAGSSISCQFEISPSTVVLTDFDDPSPALVVLTFTWDTSGC